MKGRKRTPTPVLKARGAWIAKGREAAEPKPAAGVPSCPAILDRDGKAEFKRLCNELRAMGTLAKADRTALAALADAWSRFAVARRMLNKEGIVYVTERGNSIVHPAVRVINAAVDQIAKLSAVFGLTPADRSKATVPRGVKGSDLDEFMAKAPTLKVSKVV